MSYFGTIYADTELPSRAKAVYMLSLIHISLAAEAQGEVGVYYINKNKAKSPSLAAGVQFPGGVHGLDGFIHSIHAVSYTHLDVYKRQGWGCGTAIR